MARLDPSFWLNRRVLVTGHTGFKGTWLAAWLSELGADVVGLGLPPGHAAPLHVLAGIAERTESLIADVRDRDVVTAAVRDHQPEVIFHLAAQPLVLPGLKDPVLTFETNVTGTLNLLEAARGDQALRAVVVVTSDKVYARTEAACSEAHPLGGDEPYGASKAAAEMVAACYGRSYLNSADGVGLATVRAGNVIGGGDFSPHRLIPDMLRAGFEGRNAVIRHPEALRPWQHVLDALAGYLTLAQQLALDPARFEGAWNFGPFEREWQVREVAEAVAGHLGVGFELQPATPAGGAEAPVLRLSSRKARERLGWRPLLDTSQAIRWTCEGYRRLIEDESAEWLYRSIGSFTDRHAGQVAKKPNTASRAPQPSPEAEPAALPHPQGA